MIFGRPVLLITAVALAGCGSIEKLNPVNWFSGEPKVKMAELQPISATAQLRTLFLASAGGSGPYVFTPAPAGDSLFVAAHDGTLARYDRGREVWRTNAGERLSGGVGSDGRIVVVGTPEGEVLAFDNDGKALWRARVSSEVLSAPQIAQGMVLVRSGDSRLFALDAADGRRKWVYQRATPALTLRSQPTVAVADDVAVAGFPGGRLVAVALNNGAAVWEAAVALPRGTTELERVADVASSPVIAAGQVCAAAYQGRVACFDLASGNHSWSRDISSVSGIDADERALYVSDDKGAVHALDLRNGASLWTQDKLYLRQVSRPVILDTHVAVADVKGVVHLLRREDGAFAARYSTDGSAVTAEPVRLDEGFVVQTRNGAVHALAVSQ